MLKKWETPELTVLLRVRPGDGTNAPEFSCKQDSQFKLKPDRAVENFCVWDVGGGQTGNCVTDAS